MLLGKMKINIAVLICTAFIFRLLFVNIGLVSSLNNRHNNSTINRHFSTIIKKRRKQFEPVATDKSNGYSSVEILEEDKDNKELFRLNSFPLLFLFYSKIEFKIQDILKKITPFNKRFAFNSSHRRLEYRVFRI
jgi:hypothetical protein